MKATKSKVNETLDEVLARLDIEHQELKDRIAKLSAFINRVHEKKKEGVILISEDDHGLLEDQFRVMSAYASVLKTRIDRMQSAIFATMNAEH